MNLVVDVKGNENEVRVYLYWGYVKAGIEGTELEFREDTFSNDTHIIFWHILSVHSDQKKWKEGKNYQSDSAIGREKEKSD